MSNENSTPAPSTTGGSSVQTLDPGARWCELTGFRRDMLAAISRLEQANEPCYGLAVQELLEKNHGQVHHGHLYTNLEALVEDGYVEKGEIDARTNSYALTDETRELLESAARGLADACGLSVVDPAEG